MINIATTAIDNEFFITGNLAYKELYKYYASWLPSFFDR
jgi:hypothetical protein